jgi:hypothetical protein
MKSKVNKLEELNSMTKTNILIEWTRHSSRTNIKLEGRAHEMAEAALNQCNEVLSIGSEVKDIKIGDFVLMGGTGRLITLNGVKYGIIKEHMVDAVFSSKPRIGEDEGVSQGGINTTITREQVKKFSQKQSDSGNPNLL